MSAQREPEWSRPDPFELIERARDERTRVLREIGAGLQRQILHLTTAARNAVRGSPAPAVLPKSEALIS